jgi:hypothetical protein
MELSVMSPELPKRTFGCNDKTGMDIPGFSHTEKMLDIYRKVLVGICGEIESGNRAKSKEIIIQAAKKLYSNKNNKVSR